METLSSAPTDNAVLECVLKDDLQALKLLFEDPSEPEKRRATDLLFKKDLMGRNVLFPACILGRCEVVKELIKYGASVNSLTSRGYSPLHCAAAWGQLDILKTLVEMGADTKACNFCNEKAYEIAIRYNKTECTDFLAWAEAKLELKMYISFVQQSITDLEKGKLNKQYKHQVMAACKSKNDWLEHTKNPTTHDFVEQKLQLEAVMQTIFNKLNTSPDSGKSTSKS
ncbi:ankyrin repeat domain-containing protein 45 [Xenopus laevis]|uniref:Ankyrin repeat domain-containing protein 45 n=2 Tax=Xenopus laevis TaxID=8355 RepID=A0A1L8GN10_XENLA|nr:ankyrin repeat domain-containing protein 45 [Xenopus laevis]XP_018114093.1 ankyrin repeat domain-containing protein 45 [Xenopus laevis]OCT85210.1 hypothetical protein XELAEV_18023375mg [Xenopus laevis]